MATKYDSQGRALYGTEWAALHGVPDNVRELGALVDPSADSVLLFDFSLGILVWADAPSIIVDASNVDYIPDAPLTATDVQGALDEVAAILDDFETRITALEAAVAAITTSSGTFSMSMTNMGGGYTQGTWNWKKVGTRVTLWSDTIATGGTSAAATNSHDVGNIPAAIRPTVDKAIACVMTNAGTFPGMIVIHNGGTATLYTSSSTSLGAISATGFGASVTVGIPGNTTLCYELN